MASCGSNPSWISKLFLDLGGYLVVGIYRAVVSSSEERLVASSAARASGRVQDKGFSKSELVGIERSLLAWAMIRLPAVNMRSGDTRDNHRSVWLSRYRAMFVS